MINKKFATLKEIQDFLVKAGWEKLKSENAWIKPGHYRIEYSTQEALQIEVEILKRKIKDLGIIK